MSGSHLGPDHDRLYGALSRAQHEGRVDLNGRRLDLRGQMAIMEARAKGITDPDQLRAIARAAKQ
jgi:hypothetical protein